MSSFSLGSKPTVTNTTAATKGIEVRPALRNIANTAKDSIILKGKADLKPTGFTAQAVGKLKVDVAPMDVDLPMQTKWPALPAGIEDIDMEEEDNPILVAEYVNDIYAYMCDLEVIFPSLIFL